MNLELGQYLQDGFQDFAHFIKAKSGVGFRRQQIHVVYFNDCIYSTKAEEA